MTKKTRTTARTIRKIISKVPKPGRTGRWEIVYFGKTGKLRLLPA